MNGAHSLLTTLVDAGVDVCFANPGTSEMHFVAALDTVDGMRGVLTLFEGVATGAADGYARIAGGPAAVLLHLGPGLGNGLANLHNARRAHTPMIVVVGDHATYHKKYDAPLESDIDAVAGTVSGWVRRTLRPEDVAEDTMAALAAVRRGEVATLILPADVSWTDGEAGAVQSAAASAQPAAAVDGDAVQAAAQALYSGEHTVLLIGGDATHGPGLAAAVRIGEATGATVLCETFPARLQRGAGVPAVDRLAYFAEAAAEQLAGARHLVSPVPRPGLVLRLPRQGQRSGARRLRRALLAPHRGAADALRRLADDVAPGTRRPSRHPLGRSYPAVSSPRSRRRR